MLNYTKLNNGGDNMTLYGINTKRELHVKLTKADVARLINAKYGTQIKPEEVSGTNKKRRER